MTGEASDELLLDTRIYQCSEIAYCFVPHELTLAASTFAEPQSNTTCANSSIVTVLGGQSHRIHIYFLPLPKGPCEGHPKTSSGECPLHIESQKYQFRE